MNTYQTSTGERVTQPQIDSRIRKAKAEALKNQFNEYGYNYCEECGKSSGTRLDCSHDISVKKAKENSQTEQCWNVGNITITCRECHQQKDGLALKFNLINNK